MLVVTIVCVVAVVSMVAIQALLAPTCPECGGLVVPYVRSYPPQSHQCLNCRSYWWPHQIKGRK